MEAVPRLPMISFDLKVSPDRPPTEFSKLKQYIREFYNEDPETYSTEIRNLESLRAQAVHPLKDVNGCTVLKQYFCQLHFLQSRFPICRDGPAAIGFTWREIYSGVVCTITDIKYEIVAILYNIGALHSQMGASDDRTTPEGLKMACTHYQCAAWAFQHIKDSYGHPSGVDISTDLMQFMYQLCLAQAQECILEKSMTDNRKATINARVATQIVDYYNLAQNALVQSSNEENTVLDIVGSKLMKTWKRYVKFKATYYGCVSLLYQGMQSEEQQKMGERVAYFQAALDKLNEAIKLSKGLDQAEAVTESLLFTRDVVECKRKAAKSENEFIYHEEVVDIDSLPTIKGASLVKGISFNINDPDISGPDIFSRLVPMKAHEASSLYSEEKAKLSRKINGLIDAKDEEVVSFMSCLQLEHLKAHLEPNSLPQEVVDRCAALSVKLDAIPNLIAAMDKLNDAYHDVDGMLLEIMELIKIEEKNEKEYQEVMGSRAPSIVATDLTREANKYMEAHKKAADSNETLNRAMSQHVENLRVLQQSLPQLQAQLPTLAPLKLEDNEILKELTMLVGKVDEMRKQRAMLTTQLRESICSDDITTILVTRSTENLDNLFEEELKKHDKYVKLIEQNLAAQDNILKALTDAYARYAPTRKATAEIIKQRELMLSALISSYDAYEDLIAKSSKGMEFYRKLETNLTKLLQRVKGTCKVQQEEREAILAKNNIKIGQESSVNPDVPSTGPKLKDYLAQKRKEAQNYSGGVPISYPVEAGQNWLPGVRPAPVGSEVTQPLISSSKSNEYSAPVNAYPGPGSQPYQQPYAMYQTPYQAHYQLPLNNLQYPTLSDQSLPVDSAPTAPYRPDSRASTSSDHSVTQQQVPGQTPVPITPSPDPKASPNHIVGNQLTSNLPMPLRQDQAPPTNPAAGHTLQYSNYPQGSYQYQGGYSYPSTYNSNFQTDIVNPQANSYSTPPLNTQSSNPYMAQSQHPNKAKSPESNAYKPQQPLVTNIQVNSSTYQQPLLPAGAHPASVTSQPSGAYNADQYKASVNQSYAAYGQQSNTPNVLNTNPSNYYNPSQAKPMSVPNASYSGPYGSNTVSFPYANYYTSQVYNGNMSSTATDKTSYSLQTTLTSTQPTSSVSVADNPQSAFSPTLSNQIPTTTYTVPAIQQYNNSNQGKTQHNYTPTTQPYAAPSLVSPTQTSYNITVSGVSQLDSGQTSSAQIPGKSHYSSAPQVNSSQPASAIANDPSAVNTTKAAASAEYHYPNQSQAYPQYSNYYYPSGQAVGGYAAQPGQMPYSNYGAQYAAQFHGSTYPSEQANAPTNPYGTSSVSNPYQNYATQPSTDPTNPAVPIATAAQNSSNYSRPQPVMSYNPQNQPQSNLNQPPTQNTQINYSHGVSNYSSSNQTGLQQQQSSLQSAQQHHRPVNYIASTQPSNYIASSHQPGAVYVQPNQASLYGQVPPGGYGNYPSVTQPQVGYNTGYNQTATNQSVNYPNSSQPTVASQPESKSNVDLLAGLDFNISDAPLQPLPQQPAVSQISDSLTNLNIDTKPPEPQVSINGESKPQVLEKNTIETKEEDTSTSITNITMKTDETGSKTTRDPFTDADALNLFVQEVDKFEKFVEGLCEKTLSGPTPLDIKWNELQDLQEKDAHRQNISVARCYPMKNRFSDILPYDNSTVELPSTKDDYINASFVKNMCSGCPDFILTQAPLPSTYADFWSMILEQHVELVICLLSDSQMNGEIYWPESKSDDLIFGHIRISLQSCNAKLFWNERIISVSNSKITRVIVHLQFTAWPNSWFPESPGPWLQLIGETLSVWRGCRNPEHCIVVHCDAGVGRSGLFVATAAALSEMLLSPHIPEMVPIGAKLAKWRKNPLRDRDHLKFAYQTMLYYCQDILMKRGILSNKGTFEEKRSKGKSHTRHPSQDFLLSSSTHTTSEERRHSDASSTGSRMSEIDPLNQLDPLWQIKRNA